MARGRSWPQLTLIDPHGPTYSMSIVPNWRFCMDLGPWTHAPQLGWHACPLHGHPVSTVPSLLYHIQLLPAVLTAFSTTFSCCQLWCSMQTDWFTYSHHLVHAPWAAFNIDVLTGAQIMHTISIYIQFNNNSKNIQQLKRLVIRIIKLELENLIINNYNIHDIKMQIIYCIYIHIHRDWYTCTRSYKLIVHKLYTYTYAHRSMYGQHT